MPRASSICLRNGCLKIAIIRSYCNEHKPTPWVGSKRNLERPSNWSSVRNLARRRDKNTCRSCGNPGKNVDHITPVAQGGSWSLSNLQVLCTQCHDTKTKQESRGSRSA